MDIITICNYRKIHKTLEKYYVHHPVQTYICIDL